jgi:hypothetical protein
MSSSGSLDRLRPVEPIAPRFAADMFGRSGELYRVSFCFLMVMKVSWFPRRRFRQRIEFWESGDVPHRYCIL